MLNLIKNKNYEKVFCYYFAIIGTFVSINAMSDGGDEPEKITIPIDKELTDVPNEFERSMSFPVVEACALL